MAVGFDAPLDQAGGQFVEFVEGKGRCERVYPHLESVGANLADAGDQLPNWVLAVAECLEVVVTVAECDEPAFSGVDDLAGTERERSSFADGADRAVVDEGTEGLSAVLDERNAMRAQEVNQSPDVGRYPEQVGGHDGAGAS